MDQPLLTVRGLAKAFGAFSAVSALNLDVCEGEIVALLGPSGCGKTTTLRMIAGFERPSAGEIAFAGRALSSVARRVFIPPDKRNFGMVFQSYALWPHMTVFQNVTYPLKLRRVPAAERRQRVEALLSLLGLAALVDQPVHTLSGGQQQRTAIARALVYRPALILFDEPFSNLDAQLRSQMRVELKALQSKLHMTAVFVTHDQVEALSLANRIAIMRAGRIEQFGTPADVYDRPANRFVYDFLGKNATFAGIVTEIASDGMVSLTADGSAARGVQGRTVVDVRVAAGAPAAISVREGHVTVRPENAAASPPGVNRVVGRIDNLLFTGDRQEARIAVAGASILIDLPRGQGWAERQSVLLEFPAAATTVWPLDQHGS